MKQSEHPLFSCLLAKLVCGRMKKIQNEKDNEVQIDETLNNSILDLNFNLQSDEDGPPTYEEIMENGEID